MRFSESNCNQKSSFYYVVLPLLPTTSLLIYIPSYVIFFFKCQLYEVYPAPENHCNLDVRVLLLTEHRITAWLGWKGPQIPRPHPCRGLVAPHQLRLPRAHPWPWAPPGMGHPQLWAALPEHCSSFTTCVAGRDRVERPSRPRSSAQHFMLVCQAGMVSGRMCCERKE